MNDWVYNFPPTPKADWIRQIERDLKGKSLSSIQQEWWNGAVLDPIHHADDQPTRVNLPAHLFAQPPIIIEHIDARGLSADSLNKQLVEALQFGAQRILLQISESLLSQYEVWLNGIYTDMVTWYVIGDQISSSVVSTFAAQAPGNIFQAIHRDKDSSIDSITNHHFTGDINLRWIYSIPNEGNWIAACAEVFKQIQADAQRWSDVTGKDDHLSRCELHLEAPTDYAKGLIQMRTLHLVWQNFTADDAHQQQSTIANDYLICQTKPKAGESADAYLVSATTAAVAAFLAGVSGLCIHPSVDSTPNHYLRINRNIHHLLHMESGLPRNTDTMAGSYAVDHYTAAWASAIWEKLNGA
jgi:hypothetical protein